MRFPPEAIDFEEEMLGIAARIAEAEDLGTVAVQAGQLAGSCGRCHQAMDRGPRFEIGTDAPSGTSQEAQMIRHLWAADRMWEGLIGPSDAAWIAGARAMADTQPSLARAYRASTSPDESESFLREVNLLATEAVNAVDLEDRTDAYGRLLTTCHRCHSPAGTMVQK
jgi:cytochrome c553